MKVLHVEAGRHLYGGALQVLYLMRGLAAEGVTNVLVAPENSAILGESGGCAVSHPIRWRGDADIGVIGRIHKAIGRHAPDVVHLHSRRGADLFGLLAARRSGVPAVVTRRVDNREPAWLARFKYGLAHKVIAISDGIASVLRAQGVPAGLIATVHSAVDTSAYATPCDRAWFCDTLTLPSEAITLGVVAQLIPRKGHRYLMDILPPMLAAHPKLEVLFFGRGPLDAALRRQAAESRYEDRVHLAGFREDLSRLIGCLDLVVHPADMEGLGVSLLQAAAAGVPMIASRAGGIPEVVRHEVNGLLIPPGDRDALADAIERLLDDAALRRSLGDAGRQVAREFSIEAMVAGNRAVYEALVAEAGGLS